MSRDQTWLPYSYNEVSAFSMLMPLTRHLKPQSNVWGPHFQRSVPASWAEGTNPQTTSSKTAIQCVGATRHALALFGQQLLREYNLLWKARHSCFKSSVFSVLSITTLLCYIYFVFQRQLWSGGSKCGTLKYMMYTINLHVWPEVLADDHQPRNIRDPSTAVLVKVMTSPQKHPRPIHSSSC